ncbi:protease inhibitor EpiC4 [Phytophthora palmivora]|uniref:Protease inhibitor EpiC4 n=1 Tax=Phytophthora palmivora TaxID=4796 RepID=A0A2P4X7P3_9STRA|nr:protease inhibitor EpiC4 [Phytophthora palmivora]
MRPATLLFHIMLLVLLTMSQAATYHLVGQWMPATKNTATENLLIEALQKQNPSIKSRVCFTEVTAIEQQIVNGIHFRYHVRGCETDTPGRCNSGTCTNEKKFDVELFTQPWADILQVMSAVNVQ